MKFQPGDKVVATKKSIGIREFDNSASFYKRLELNQDYLFVNALDESSTKEHGEPCYWCDAVRGMGDRYKESDLIPYIKADATIS